MKLSSLHKEQGDEVAYTSDLDDSFNPPSQIYVTSLFTYSWRAVHETVEFYRRSYPTARVTLGGIYATLMPEHGSLTGADEIRSGLTLEAERFLPDYSLTPDWNSSIMFATRGCIRKCAFCAVPKLEGKTWGPANTVRDLVHPDHKKVVLWDNNILGVPNWREVVAELHELKVEVDFNQGLDARLVTEEVAQELAKLRVRPIRMAYDIPGEKKALEKAIPALERAGFNRRRMHVYTLYNFTDTPEGFLQRVIDLLSWGVVSYPMRYEPLSSLVKNKYVSPHWTAQQLELVAKARRVLGYGGAFPPYKALLDKFLRADSFEEAFYLRPKEKPQRPRRGVAGLVESLTEQRDVHKARFREILNDPSTLLASVRCRNCDNRIHSGESAFAVQDYAGKYVAYICADCHPNRKWINGLWRSALGEKFSVNGHQPKSLPGGLISRTVH